MTVLLSRFLGSHCIMISFSNDRDTKTLVCFELLRCISVRTHVTITVPLSSLDVSYNSEYAGVSKLCELRSYTRVLQVKLFFIIEMCLFVRFILFLFTHKRCSVLETLLENVSKDASWRPERWVVCYVTCLVS